MTAPDVTIIIPAHNAGGLLLAQLDALSMAINYARHRGVRSEIIVVDNRSTDGSTDRVRAWSDAHNVELRLVVADTRLGEPHARNVGAAAARSDRLAYCDSDDIVSREWALEMGLGLKDFAYVTGPVETRLLNQSWQMSMAGGRRLDAPGMAYGTVPFAHGCNIGIRRSSLIELGGFDETYLTGCDIDLGIRAWRSGIALGWLPGAVLHYRLRTTLREGYRQAKGYGRSRPRLRASLHDILDRAAERRATARRCAWLIRHLPLTGDRAALTHWLWIAGQVDGEARGSLRMRLRQ